MRKLFLSALMAGTLLSSWNAANARSSYIAKDDERQCSADQLHVNDLVSYAEKREQRLPAAAMNSINPGENGSVRVQGWDQADVLVKACVQAAAQSEAEARVIASQVAITSSPGKIEAKGPARDDHAYCGLSYEVWVPSASNLDVKANNGSVRIDAVHGQIRFHTLNGSVHLLGLGGDVDGSTTNGSLRVELAGVGWNGRGLRAETTNGSVRLSVPRDYSAKFETSTVNGGLHVDFPVNVEGEVGRSISFQLGAGGASIEAKTVNGAVHISRGE